MALLSLASQKRSSVLKTSLGSSYLFAKIAVKGPPSRSYDATVCCSITDLTSDSNHIKPVRWALGYVQQTFALWIS